MEKNRKPSVLLKLAGIVLTILFVAYFGISSIVADRLSRPERHALTTTPAAYELAYESVRFASAVDNIPLSGWFIDSPGTRAIVILHGRNGTRDSTEPMEIAQALVRSGYDVLLFDFRAHGESGGERYTLGYLETRDVAGAVRYLQSRGATEIGVIGFSMGAVTVLNSAPDQPELRAIVSDSAFADASPLVERELPKAGGLPVFFDPGVLLMGRLLYGVDIANNKPMRAVAHLGHRPVLLIHGSADGLIPVGDAYALQRAGANNPNLELWIVPEAEHTGAHRKNREEYLKRVIGFFDQNLQ